MSASSYTDHLITCNGPACHMQRWASELTGRDLTAADVRRVLRMEGWLVNVRREDGLAWPLPANPRERLDYCPEHAAEITGKGNGTGTV